MNGISVSSNKWKFETATEKGISDAAVYIKNKYFRDVVKVCAYNIVIPKMKGKYSGTYDIDLSRVKQFFSRTVYDRLVKEQKINNDYFKSIARDLLLMCFLAHYTGTTFSDDYGYFYVEDKGDFSLFLRLHRDISVSIKNKKIEAESKDYYVYKNVMIESFKDLKDCDGISPIVKGLISHVEKEPKYDFKEYFHHIRGAVGLKRYNL